MEEKEVEEICPVCAEKGISEPRKVRVEKEKDRVIKYYSPCGHKHVTVTIEEKIVLQDLIQVHPETAKKIRKYRKKIEKLLGIEYELKKRKIKNE